MKADLTRNTFYPFRHFTRVLMQQGRVQLDADWNEQAAILLRYLRSMAADIIGPHGGPAGNLGFRIVVLPPATSPVADFAITAGHYYVDGILCEINSTPVSVTAVQTQSNIVVARWIVDGIPFQPGQYLELYDSATKPHSVIVSIRVATQSTLSLNLTPDINSFDWITNKNASLFVRRILTYTSQPDYPVSDKLNTGTSYLVYLDIWERLITRVEDDRIREVALGGPDTAARTKLVTQVKVTTVAQTAPGSDNPQDATSQSLSDKFQPWNRGFLKARTLPSAASSDPSVIPTPCYWGAENQLYRVEIHTGSLTPDGPKTPTFKWSRENGSAVFPILSGGGTTLLTLETLGRDDRHDLSVGDWIEIQDDASVLLNRPVPLQQIQSIDSTSMQVTLNGCADPSVGKDPAKHPLLRRWDQKEIDGKDGGLQLGGDHAALIVEGTSDTEWFNLENGIQIQFQQAVDSVPATYRTGDYWLIPARTATGDIEWPTQAGEDGQGNRTCVPATLPPDGVDHRFAPLAIITLDGKSAPAPCQFSFGSAASRPT